MAGPGIRYYHLARVLAREFDVTLATPNDPSALSSQPFSVLQYDPERMAALEKTVEQSHVVLVPAICLTKLSPLLQLSVPLVIDGYDPFLVESLSLHARKTRGLQRALTQAYLAGDFFICASERQRTWWLGLLEATGRVNLYTFQEDPSLRRLVDRVPFGLPEEPPSASRRVVKGEYSGIEPDDKIILWGGGLWPWLDPLTAIRAVAKIWEQRRDIRLIFPGTEHPNPKMKGIPTHSAEARELAREEGLLDKAVLFGEWIPYEDWPSVLLESDIALTLHYDTLEARLAFRSRVLDYIWAGLPTVATRGDATSDLIADYDLGVVVDYEDADGVAEAIGCLLKFSPRTLEDRFSEARRELTWEQAAQPLIRFCRNPHRAPDKVALGDDLGNPFYVEDRKHLVEERNRWRELVRAYEAGRFMQVMRLLDRVARRLRSK